PDVDGHEEGFCVKIVEGVLSVWKHSTPSFFTSQGLGSSSTRRNDATLGAWRLTGFACSGWRVWTAPTAP
ncbi:hypothetical protein CSW47_02570, partial [Thermus scotoductus]